MICIGDFDLGVGIVVGIGMGVLFKLIWDYYLNRVITISVSRERLKDILKFSEEHPSPKKGLYPTNIFKLNDKEEYLEIK